MTEKKIKRIVENYDTVYVASDGKEFSDKETCSMYEKTFSCAMKSYLRDISIRETSTEEDLFATGSCENEVFIVQPTCMEDIIHIKQFAIGLGASEEKASKWCNESDINSILLITVGYNDEWVYINRLNTIINNIVGNKYKLIPTIN